jgi:hypothetical protein
MDFENQGSPKSREQNEKKENPNRIFEMIGSFTAESGGVVTSPEKVYRALRDYAAIEDLENSGVVRGRRAAGMAHNPKYGDTVYWTKGKEGSYIPVNYYVIEAPLSVAEKGIVTKRDVTAIYVNQDGKISDILEQNVREENRQSQQYRVAVEKDETERLQDVRKKLGLE